MFHKILPVLVAIVGMSHIAETQAVSEDPAKHSQEETQQYNKEEESNTLNKDSVKTLFKHMFTIDKLLADKDKDKEAHKAIEGVKELMPALEKMKFFEIFPPEDWLHAKKKHHKINTTKVLVATLYLQEHPNEVTEEISKQIKKLEKEKIPSILKEELAKIRAD